MSVISLNVLVSSNIMAIKPFMTYSKNKIVEFFTLNGFILGEFCEIPHIAKYFRSSSKLLILIEIRLKIIWCGSMFSWLECKIRTRWYLWKTKANRNWYYFECSYSLRTLADWAIEYKINKKNLLYLSIFKSNSS